MVVQTLLIFIIAFIACSEFFLGTSLIQRPIILGTLVGLAFGQLETGIVMGGNSGTGIYRCCFDWCLYSTGYGIRNDSGGCICD